MLGHCSVRLVLGPSCGRVPGTGSSSRSRARCNCPSHGHGAICRRRWGGVNTKDVQPAAASRQLKQGATKLWCNAVVAGEPESPPGFPPVATGAGRQTQRRRRQCCMGVYSPSGAAARAVMRASMPPTRRMVSYSRSHGRPAMRPITRKGRAARASVVPAPSSPTKTAWCLCMPRQALSVQRTFAYVNGI